MELWDTHCHLTESPLRENLAEVLFRARARGVQHVVAAAVDRPSWRALDSLAGQPGVHFAYGLHPWFVDGDFTRAQLEHHIDKAPTPLVAIGEIGLDYKIEQPDRELQETALRVQLDLAVDRNLPVLLHCRGAFEELLSILGGYADGGLRGIVHAFSKGPQLADRFLKLGFHLAFGGGITRQNARRPQKSAIHVPLDRLLLETDAPSIGLEGVPPELVEPGHVCDVAAKMAELRGLSVEEVAASTSHNARELFGSTS